MERNAYMYLKKYFKLTSTLISYSCLLEHCAAELTEVWNHKMFSGIWLSHCLLLEILLKVFAMLFFSFPLPHYVHCVHLFSQGKPKLYAFTCRKNFLFTRVDNCVCVGKGLYKNRAANLSWDILGQVTFQGWKQFPFHPQYTESQGFPSLIHDKHICLNTRFFTDFSQKITIMVIKLTLTEKSKSVILCSVCAVQQSYTVLITVAWHKTSLVPLWAYSQTFCTG